MSGKSIAHAVLQTCNCVTKRLAILRLQSFMISYTIQSWHQSYKITGTRTTKETAQQNHKQQKPPTKKNAAKHWSLPPSPDWETLQTEPSCWTN